MKSPLVRLLLCACALVACSSESDGAGNEGATRTSTSTSTSTTTTASSEVTTTEMSTTTTTAAPETTVTEAEPPELCGVSVIVSFNESAPRDSMTIVNASTGDVSFTAVEFDLASSAGGVIFDTLDGGAGVEVFQGFQREAGDAVLAQDPAAEDGASNLSLDFGEFSAGQTFTFSIDVDDQLADSDLGQIQVTGSEMAGARVTMTAAGGEEVVAIFDDADNARFDSDC